MLESVASLIATTTLLLGSPGPAPLALAATGAAHGVRKGAPFLAGILVGLSIAIVGATTGVAVLLSALPELRFALQVIGALYISFIAFKIATAPVQSIDGSASSSAPAFVDGFILNLLNPKAYAAFLAIFSQFLLPFSDSFVGYVTTGVVCLLVAAIVDFLWLCFGGIIRPLFVHPKQARALRIFLAVTMIFVVLWTF